MTDISTLKLYSTPEHPCSYLEDQAATTVFIDPNAELNARLYSELSDFGFRRSGRHIYRPHCAQCQACIPVRIPVETFKPNRSQKRCIKRNTDLRIERSDDINNNECFDLYSRYIKERHNDGDMYPPTRKQYQEFLSAEWGVTRFLKFYADDKLIAVAVSDFLDQGMSAIYTFFEPSENARSLGTLAVLEQINEAKSLNLPFVYLGYWIKDCDKMRYKNQFKPLQMLINQKWLTLT